jgi:hypothetical protein
MVLTEAIVGNESQFFAADLCYPSWQDLESVPSGSRCLFVQSRSSLSSGLSRSSIAIAQDQGPEVASFQCVDPVETAADKLRSLAWHVCAPTRR